MGRTECAKKSKMIIDSHQHLWDPRALDFPPFPPGMEALSRAFLTADLKSELTNAGVNKTVLVQGYPQTYAANDWYFNQANSADFISGVVAWVDLENPRDIGDRLNDLRSQPKFVGVRHIVEGEANPRWLENEHVLKCLRELQYREIPFDFVGKPKHIPSLLTALSMLPDLKVVVDHLGKPEISHGGFSEWASYISDLGQFPNVYCKISGLVTEADWNSWSMKDFKPYVRHVIQVFGYDRVLFGSDWPICLVAAGYRQVLEVALECLGQVSSEVKSKVFAENAVLAYNLEI
jgi:L-fuconolactonase